MATVSRGLPEQPHLDVPKREARALLAAWRAQQPEALERVRARHPKFRDAGERKAAAASEGGETKSAPAPNPGTAPAFKLADAQLVLAREYGFSNWAELKQRIEKNHTAVELQRAIHAGDREAVVRLLRAQPELLHVPLWSGNWGPPMSHAANLDRLEIVQAISELGARDHQHAFDRALLQGRIETARWLHAHGTTLAPGLVMGSCETQNPAGFSFLLELGAAITDDRGDRLAPLALTLETYGRRTEGKHALLALFAQHGYALPDTPLMALHRGDLARLRQHLRDDPGLLARRFALREIYPPELGCVHEGTRTGMHWTPIDGGTLLHLAVDFREREIFDWLLAEAGADPNARATVDAEGFGGHTPLFNAVVNGPWPDATFAQGLLARGAEREARANLRKFLDWREEPYWHIAREVTPTEWAATFPDQSWVDGDALAVLARTGG